jgi:hypothetical protein
MKRGLAAAITCGAMSSWPQLDRCQCGGRQVVLRCLALPPWPRRAALPPCLSRQASVLPLRHRAAHLPLSRCAMQFCYAIAVPREKPRWFNVSPIQTLPPPTSSTPRAEWTSRDAAPSHAGTNEGSRHAGPTSVGPIPWRARWARRPQDFFPNYHVCILSYHPWCHDSGAEETSSTKSKDKYACSTLLHKFLQIHAASALKFPCCFIGNFHLERFKKLLLFRAHFHLVGYANTLSLFFLSIGILGFWKVKHS